MGPRGGGPEAPRRCLPGSLGSCTEGDLIRRKNAHLKEKIGDYRAKIQELKKKATPSKAAPAAQVCPHFFKRIERSLSQRFSRPGRAK